MLEGVRSHLLTDLSKEYACQILCGQNTSNGHMRLLGAYLVTPQDSEYLRQTGASLELDRAYDVTLVNECATQSLSLIDFHSHPFSTNSVAFSGVDDADEIRKAIWFSKHLPDLSYGSVVVGREAMLGRVFRADTASGRITAHPLGIRSLSESLDAPALDLGHPGSNPFDRQIRAFGLEGQNRLAKLRVAVVGVGGLGSIIAHGLCRLGVGHLTLIDPDHVDETNLNRWAGLTARLARRRPLKVDLMARRLRSIRPELSLDPCSLDIFETAAWRKLVDTDLIVASTDNHATRMLTNQIGNQFLIPTVSCGVQITTRAEQFEDGYAEIFVHVPGQDGPCLVCSKVVDPVEAYYEVVPDDIREEGVRRGYIQDFAEPAPAVYHLNGIAANLALVEIHNLACGFMPRQPHCHYVMSRREVRPIRHSPTTKCPVCTPNGVRFARGDAVDPLQRMFSKETQHV